MNALFRLLACASCLAALGTAGAQQVEAPLGFPITIPELYIPGSKIEPVPRKDRAGSLVIRILEIKPAADGFRYDLEVYGLDPGTHDLETYLQRIDGDPLGDLQYRVKVTTTQPLDTLPRPRELAPVSPEKLGGYRLLTMVLGAIWLGVFLLILFYRKRPGQTAAAQAPPPTLHEKLMRLVGQAAEGTLSESQRAQLERLIVGHWKREVPELATLPPDQALRRLRAHPEASPLLLELEKWLHAPDPSATQGDINRLLTPFR